MNRKQRRRAAKDLSLRLNKLKGYARKGSARARALLVLAKKQWSGEGITEEEMMAFNGRFEDAAWAEPARPLEDVARDMGVDLDGSENDVVKAGIDAMEAFPDVFRRLAQGENDEQVP